MLAELAWLCLCSLSAETKGLSTPWERNGLTRPFFDLSQEEGKVEGGGCGGGEGIEGWEVGGLAYAGRVRL